MPGTPARKRHWWRWILAGVVVLAALVVLAVGLAFKFQPTASPLALPTSTARPPAPGPADGTWDITAGSVAGFRLRETLLGMGDDVTGRTTDVAGTIVISGSRVIQATLHVDLTTITISGKTPSQLAASLDTRAHPEATFTLGRPVTLSPAFGSGAVIRLTAAGQLTLRGITRAVTVTISARRDGTVLQAAGSIPVTLARWGITEPNGYGFGSLADQGTAEFLVTLHRDDLAGRHGGTVS